jgi:hypothetical protein
MSENRAAHTGKGAQREGVGLGSPATWLKHGERAGDVQGWLADLVTAIALRHSCCQLVMARAKIVKRQRILGDNAR